MHYSGKYNLYTYWNDDPPYDRVVLDSNLDFYDGIKKN